jgi:hypothetical protein
VTDFHTVSVLNWRLRDIDTFAVDLILIESQGTVLAYSSSVLRHGTSCSVALPSLSQSRRANPRSSPPDVYSFSRSPEKQSSCLMIQTSRPTAPTFLTSFPGLVVKLARSERKLV